MSAPAPEEVQRIASECQAIALAFALHVDFGQDEACAHLFTEDGTFERKGEVLIGRARILAELKSRPPNLRTRHHCLTPYITVIDAQNAEGVTYFTTYRHEGGAPGSGPAPLSGPEVVGEFYDRFVATPTGWRMRSRAAKAAFRRAPGG